MSKMLCPKCHELISASARRCPECGYVLKPNWTALIVGIIIILSFAVVLIAPLLIKFREDKPKPDSSQIAKWTSDRRGKIPN